MNRARIEILVVLAALAHLFFAGRAAISRPNRGEAEQLYSAARGAEELGEFDAAAFGYYEIFREHPYAPQAAEAGFRLARVLCRGFQEFDKAEIVLENCVEAYPGTTHGEGARKMLEFLRKHRPGQEDAVVLFYRAQGDIHGKKKDLAGARGKLDELLQKFPNSSLAPEARKVIAELERKAAAGK